jgi:hypothetical protein
MKGLDNLTLLKILDISHNLLSSIKGLEQLSALEIADLSFNLLTSMADSGIKEEVFLLVGNNKIDHISLKDYTWYFSHRIYTMTINMLDALTSKSMNVADGSTIHNLRDKLMRYERITDREKRDFEKVTLDLQLLPNSFSNLPPEVIRQGKNAILNYLTELEQAGTEYLYEAKMLIVGQPRAGKISLCRKLFDKKADLSVEDETTRGIDIQQLRFEVSDLDGKVRKFHYNVWDFGGQQIYQTTHQFF